MQWIRVALMWLYSGLVLAAGGDMQGNEADMRSQHYQLLHISPDMPPTGRWDQEHQRLVLDLLSFKDRLDAAPEPARRYLARLTDNFTRSVLLRDVLARDDVVYFSDYWTRKGSVLNIVEYRKTGTSTDLTPYLGPLSSIPTASYGFAKYQLHYKGEVLPFWGVAQKDKWTLRKRYWARAQVFMPFAESAGLDVAIIGMDLGVNHMDPVGSFLLLPRDDL